MVGRRTRRAHQAAKFVDELRLVLGRAADLAPRFYKQPIDLGVLQVLELPHEVGGDVGRRHAAGGHRFEQRQAKRGTRAERRQRGSLLLRRQVSVRGQHRGGRRGVVVHGQPREGRFADDRLAEQVNQSRQQGRVLDAEQRIDRLPPRSRVGVAGLHRSAERFERRRIPERHAERDGLQPHVFAAAVTQFGERGRPVRRRSGLPLALERFAQTGEDFGVFLGVVGIDDPLHQRHEGGHVAAAGDASDHELPQ